MTASRSIRGGVLRTQLVWSVLSGLALAVALWLAVQSEVDELLDDSLTSAAELLIGPMLETLPPASSTAPRDGAESAGAGARFVWQLVRHDPVATVLASATGAPAAPLTRTPTPGFGDVPGWRVYGRALGPDGRMLYVAQSHEERTEIKLEMIMTVLLAGLPLLALGLLWSNLVLRQELKPLQVLSARLAEFDPLQARAGLGRTECAELQPVHAAIDDLVARLSHRISLERAFSAHTAHALRTPLAGIEVQLAVAVREAPADLQPRLQRVRIAAQRLQHVVVALLAMFRSGAAIERQPLDLDALAAGLAMEGLQLSVQPGAPITGDADLLTAALINLLDNAQRHGAHAVTLSVQPPCSLHVHDDGSGIDDERRQALQAALTAQDYEGKTGLGLMLADMVARAHGGRLLLPPGDPPGFAAVLALGPPSAPPTDGSTNPAPHA
jgi:signal transduction histidine kinase